MYCAHPQKPKNTFFAACKQPVVPFGVLGFIGCTLSYFLTNSLPDTLIPLFYVHLAVFFASVLCFILVCHYCSSNYVQYIALLALCLLNTFILPDDVNIFGYIIPSWAERIIVAIIWSLFAQMYFVINGVDGIVSLQSLSVCLGIMIITVLGMLPIAYGCYSGIFIALFLAFSLINSYPMSLSLTTSQSRALGLIIGWLGLLTALEGAGSCFIVLSMYYIYETGFALLKRINPQTQFKLLTNNTFYARLADAGISPQNIYRFISRINLVMILLAGFQIYAPNNYTMIILAVFMIFWMIAKVTSTKETTQHMLLTSSLISLMKKNKNSASKGKNKE
jgi:UDP-N-acetylmuramyl pentapeptide phosphotransferase/UDP-N-acetylglucosamine-1-phosphate transferase